MADDTPKSAPLIVVVAFDVDDTGELQPVFGPAEQDSEERAIRMAKSLASRHAGVIAWTRQIEPGIGEYGEPKVLFQSGDVPEME